MKLIIYNKQLKVLFSALLFVIVLEWLMLVTGFLDGRHWLSIIPVLAILFCALGVALLYIRERESITQLISNSAAYQPSDDEVRSKWIRKLLDYQTEMKLNNEKANGLIQQITRGETIYKEGELDDALTNSIFKLQDELTEYRSQEKKRIWAADGHSKFSEFLRGNEESLEEFSAVIVGEIVKYIGVNQGALFIRDTQNSENGDYFKLAGTYAYNRKKYLEKRLQLGEGLVGQCMIEKDIILLTEIPEEYIKITSGLGTAPPRNIVVIPLMTEDKVFGALELASFKILEDYKIQFLKDLCENIAATFSIIQVNISTKALLEESQHLAGDLKASEEEMRQNMEELTAIQEEMTRKQLEMDGVFAAIDKSMFKAEIDVTGMFLTANLKLVEFMGWEKIDIHARRHQDLVKNDALHHSIWKAVAAGKNYTREYSTLNSLHQDCWISATYSPVYNTEGNLWKVILLGQDITDRVNKERENERLSLVADNTDNSVIITNAAGEIEYANAGFTKMNGYTLEEVMGRKPGAFLQGPETNAETVKTISTKLKSRESIYEEILNYTKSGQTYWVSLVINPIKNEAGVVTKFISVQADITSTKKAALDAKYKLEAIGRSNAVLEMDTEGMILQANENFLQILGFSKEDVIGKPHSFLMSGEAAEPGNNSQLWQKLFDGEHVEREFPCLDKKNVTKHLRGLYNTIFDINGQPHKIVIFIIDITEEKRLQHQNKKQEVELGHYMESINNTIASLTFDNKGAITDANDIYKSVTGFAIEDIIGKSYFDLLPEKDKGKPQFQIMWDSLKEGRFFSGEFKQIDKDGHEIWSSGTINPIYDIDNKVKKVMLLAQFTTKEKEKTLELNNTLNALKGVIPILELNPDFSPKAANSLFLKISGYSRMEIKNIDFEKYCLLNKIMTKHDITEQLNQEKMVEAIVDFSCIKRGEFSTTVAFAPVFNLDHQLDKILLMFTAFVGKGADIIQVKN